ncbi:MAG: hypothetical protein JOZ50_02225 [Candidatus Eremiobacteraeota bacterium]|nr:hypothetical protein [Candidatus Eremiobacteraeota bacterium]MBV8595045.1 hypothetical protein [Candidatus Eremiobacteraeota bacterium]
MRSYAKEIEDIRERLRSPFTSFFLTLLSIIQGTALAALFGKVDSLITRQAFHAPQIVMAIGIFFAIVTLWTQYQMGSLLYTWPVRVIDAFIPFVFGLFEFVMIIGMDHGAFFVLVTFGVFFVMTVFGFEYQYLQVRKNFHADAFMHRLTLGFRALDTGSSVASAAVLLGTAALISQFGPSAGYELVGAWVIVAVALGHAVRQAYQWGLVEKRLADMSEA